METIIKNKSVEVAYYPEKKLMIYQWHGLANYDLAIEAFQFTMRFIRTHSCHFVLHDASDMKETFTKLNTFMSEEVTPNFEKYGGQRSAMIISSDVFSMFAINGYLKIMRSNKVAVKVFKLREQAMQWLEEKMLDEESGAGKIRESEEKKTRFF